jgi:SNF2 family DNA or RNA helicase
MQVKFRIGNKRYPVEITILDGGKLKLEFQYDSALIAEVKMMQGRRWNPDFKYWTVDNCPRNLFTIKFLCEKNPYERYMRPLVDFKPRRTFLRDHQVEIAAHEITRRQCIVAAEMRTGKTLATIEAMEASGYPDWLWVAPKSAIYGVKLEFERWTICDICGRLKSDHKDADHPLFTTKCILPGFYTYESFKKMVDTWPEEKLPVHGLVLDESSRCKNPTAQRTQAVQIYADSMRHHYNDECMIIEMTGTPSPGKPTDWWSQLEIACPGYVREPTIKAFQERLSVVEMRENMTTGGVYPHIVCWKDSEDRCSKCGFMKDDQTKHDMSSGGHTFQPCVNEVANLYKRVGGLVLVKFKKDCWNLPALQKQRIQLQAPPDMLRAAAIINAKSSSAIEALTLLRELSDGFQYRETECGKQKCTICGGTRISKRVVDTNNPHLVLDALSIQCGYRVTYDDSGTPTQTEDRLQLREVEMACEACDGTGEIVKLARDTVMCDTPKEQAMEELVDQCEEAGRVVIYGGFTGTIDKIVGRIQRMGWQYIRVDGRGWHCSINEKNPVKMLSSFQKDKSLEKLAFIGQPSSAGMGIDLAASPYAIYFSNDFNAESRIQSEARIHGPAMNLNRGATIWDLLLLPSDELVLNNLENKKRLQDISLGEMREQMDKIKFSDIRRDF